eukprot:2272191-Rhodomonas_salina.2
MQFAFSFEAVVCSASGVHHVEVCIRQRVFGLNILSACLCASQTLLLRSNELHSPHACRAPLQLDMHDTDRELT